MRGTARGLDLSAKQQIIDVPLIALGGGKSPFVEKNTICG
jgi:hypothetical protein